MNLSIKNSEIIFLSKSLLYSFKRLSIISNNEIFIEHASITLTTAYPFLLTPNGSYEPLGRLPLKNAPTTLSILSTTDNTDPSLVLGIVSPTNLGR